MILLLLIHAYDLQNELSMLSIHPSVLRHSFDVFNCSEQQPNLKLVLEERFELLLETECECEPAHVSSIASLPEVDDALEVVAGRLRLKQNEAISLAYEKLDARALVSQNTQLHMLNSVH